MQHGEFRFYRGSRLVKFVLWIFIDFKDTFDGRVVPHHLLQPHLLHTYSKWNSGSWHLPLCQAKVWLDKDGETHVGSITIPQLCQVNILKGKNGETHALLKHLKSCWLNQLKAKVRGHRTHCERTAHGPIHYWKRWDEFLRRSRIRIVVRIHIILAQSEWSSAKKTEKNFKCYKKCRKHSMIWRVFMAVTMESAVFMGKNFQNNQNSIVNTADLSHWSKCSTYLQN